MKKWMMLPTLLMVNACGNNDNQPGKQPSDEYVKELEKRVEQNPDSATLRMRLVNSLDSMKEYREAIGHTDSLLAKDKGNQGLWVTRAHLQESNGDTAAAIASYEKAVAIYPSQDALLSLANLYAEQRNAKALSICQQVLRMGLGRETDANCNFIAAVYFARMGNSKKAIEGFDKAISDNYTLMEAYMEKGFIYYDARQYAEALKVFNTATVVSGTYADAWYWKGRCYEIMNDKPQAFENYQRALLLDKNLAEAREAVGRLGK